MKQLPICLVTLTVLGCDVQDQSKMLHRSQSPVNAISVSKDRSRLVFSSGSTLTAISATTGKVHWEVQTPLLTGAFCIDEELQRAYVIQEGASLAQIDIRRGHTATIVRSSQFDQAPMFSPVFSQSTNNICVGSQGGLMVITRNGQLICSHRWSCGGFTSIAVSPDGNHFAAGSKSFPYGKREQRLIIVDARTGKVVAQVLTDDVHGVCFLNNENLLVARKNVVELLSVDGLSRDRVLFHTNDEEHFDLLSTFNGQVCFAVSRRRLMWKNVDSTEKGKESDVLRSSFLQALTEDTVSIVPLGSGDIRVQECK